MNEMKIQVDPNASCRDKNEYSGAESTIILDEKVM